mmetsp:Transcript_33215/g.78448  ORF Transcript_33215/g.78448 Transcript_33215/m.78448 type:complete len:520 (+) Transcript_33215:84-1643(+)
MSQMSAADQAIVRALPGNDVCCDCGQKHPQWASVSFGNLFCLDCSGIHRSLGVHISFVRSIAMDSWTSKQLALMKSGGNKKCNDYLSAKGGIQPNTPVKPKYESDVAQLYKEVLKARVEGRPEPTVLPPPRNARAAAPSSGPSSSIGGGGRVPQGSNDPNGLERLTGETDQQYIQRQTRLKAEAQARMRAKFGNNAGRMGGVGSSGIGSSMQGIGSNPNYNPNNGGGGGYGIGAPDMDNVINGVSSVFSTGLSLVSSAASTAASAVNDDSTKASVSNLANTATAYGGSFWNSLKTTVGDVASSVTQPDSRDGLQALQRDIQSHKPKTSKYGGFGSTTNMNMNMNMNTSSSMFDNFGSSNNGTSMGGMSSQQNSMGGGGGGALQEAQGLPGEDRNGMERLTGETDEQYVMRQTRLRDEAKARMAAKFGGGGLSSAGPSSAPSSGNAYGGMGMGMGMGMGSVPAPAPSTASYPTGMSLGAKKATPAKAPSSFGNPASKSFNRTPPKTRSTNSDDFFANFGA